MKYLRNLNHARFRQNPNLPLFFYKYTPLFVFQTSDNEAKRRFLKLFEERRLEPRSDLIRQRVRVIRKLASQVIQMKTYSRFMCGVGYSNTLEWGLNFDWTSGVPYLPGSSFKGALLSYLEFINGKAVQDWDENEEVNLENETVFTKEQVLAIFGPQGKNIRKPNTGGVVFFDVYPVDGVSFEVDVITPHHKNYYSDASNSIPPADTENPTPIPFLTIKSGTSFLFAFRVRDREAVNDTLKEKLKGLILEAGEIFGFGAKTASGYGYFESE